MIMRLLSLLLLTLLIGCAEPEPRLVVNTGNAQGSTYQIRFLTTKSVDFSSDFEQIFEDIELILDNNNYLTYEGNDLSTDIRILSLSDDEGLLNPLGVGEIILEVRYEV